MNRYEKVLEWGPECLSKDDRNRNTYGNNIYIERERNNMEIKIQNEHLTYILYQELEL